MQRRVNLQWNNPLLLSRISCVSKPKQERAAIAGSGTGLSLAMIGYPVGWLTFLLRHCFGPSTRINALAFHSNICSLASSFLLEHASWSKVRLGSPFTVLTCHFKASACCPSLTSSLFLCACVCKSLLW